MTHPPNLQALHSIMTSQPSYKLWDCLYCNNKFYNILTLPCKHNFCEACIRSWINVYLCFDDYGGITELFPCRVCWALFKVPPAGIKALKQLDSQVTELQELLNNLSMQESSQVTFTSDSGGMQCSDKPQGDSSVVQNQGATATGGAMHVVEECYQPPMDYCHITSFRSHFN